MTARGPKHVNGPLGVGTYVKKPGDPVTEAGKALLRREDYNERSFALITADAILAIESEAAAEARRELLAAVKGLPQSDVGAMYPAGWNAALAAVLRLIEEPPP